MGHMRKRERVTNDIWFSSRQSNNGKQDQCDGYRKPANLCVTRGTCENETKWRHMNHIQLHTDKHNK